MIYFDLFNFGDIMKFMNISEINRFIDYHTRVRYYSFLEVVRDGILSTIIMPKEPHFICIDMGQLREYPLSAQKALILHEVGHLETITYDSIMDYGLGEIEFMAHRWAIEYTYRRRYWNILGDLIYIFDGWSRCRWNSFGRRYRMAYKVGEGDREWVKIYRELEKKYL